MNCSMYFPSHSKVVANTVHAMFGTGNGYKKKRSHLTKHFKNILYNLSNLKIIQRMLPTQKFSKHFTKYYSLVSIRMVAYNSNRKENTTIYLHRVHAVRVHGLLYKEKSSLMNI